MRTDAIFVPGENPSIDPVTVPVNVRVMLPPGYDANRAEPYPVLYLLHGGADDWRSWSEGGAVRDTLAQAGGGEGFDGIVVMPEGGRAGWYTDWAGETDGEFAPAWETFHIDQLVPWIDTNFNTSAARDGRAVAGLSMGGLGALMYAGRHPATFSAVGSFSGGTDIRIAGAQDIVSQSMWGVGAAIGNVGLLDGKFQVNLPWTFPPAPEEEQLKYRMAVVFGEPTASGNWPDVNPFELANVYNAYDTNFGLYSGQGLPTDSGEANIGRWNNAFDAELTRQGVDHIYCTGPGGHNFDYWKQDLVHFVDHIYGETPDTCPNGW